MAAGYPSSSHVAFNCETGIPASLDGILVSHKEYGPPGWGESPAQDSRWTMTVLILSEASKKVATSLLAPCADGPVAITQVQLWFFESTSKTWSKYKNHRVRVTGSIRGASGAPAEIQLGQFEVSEISAL
jgi:hypothetical protein